MQQDVQVMLGKGIWSPAEVYRRLLAKTSIDALLATFWLAVLLSKNTYPGMMYCHLAKRLPP